MSQKTDIEWCDSTVNPSSGCDGCELYSPKDPERATCYARAIHEQRFAWNKQFQDSGNYAKSFSEVRMIAGRIQAAATWGDLRGKLREGKPWLDLLPRTIFVGDLADFLSRGVTDEFIEREIFAPIESERGRRHIWMLLTKRPSRLADLSIRRGGLPDNVIAMTSITSQATAIARIPQLLRVRARWRGISAEPLLELVDLKCRCETAPEEQLAHGRIHWVITGGESGAQARPCGVGWIDAIVHQCWQANIPCFVKQLGARPLVPREGGEPGESAELALKDAKGGDPAEWPSWKLRVRQMPDFGAEAFGVEQKVTEGTKGAEVQA